MPTIRYHASKFPAGNALLTGNRDLQVSWAEINWAAQTVGKAEHHVGQHGIFSVFEAAYRSNIVWANLMEAPSGRLVKTPAYEALDPSEKGAISYYLGLTSAKLFAYRLLNTPWLLHFDIYGAEHEAALLGAKKPDLIGLNYEKQWIVYEAKGRTGGFSNVVLNDAKGQAGEIDAIGGMDPVLRVASLAFFRSDGLHLSVVDPPANKRSKGRKVELSRQQFFDSYYSRLGAFGAGPTRREDREGTEYRIVSLSGLDLSIGVPITRPLEPIAQFQANFEAGRFIGPDGVEIILGDAWSEANMRRGPWQRTR
jgi:hypothetical protein